MERRVRTFLAAVVEKTGDPRDIVRFSVLEVTYRHWCRHHRLPLQLLEYKTYVRLLLDPEPSRGPIPELIHGYRKRRIEEAEEKKAVDVSTPGAANVTNVYNVYNVTNVTNVSNVLQVLSPAPPVELQHRFLHWKPSPLSSIKSWGRGPGLIVRRARFEEKNRQLRRQEIGRRRALPAAHQ